MRLGVVRGHVVLNQSVASLSGTRLLVVEPIDEQHLAAGDGLGGGKPLIVMGDFNCGPGSPPYNVLTEDRGNLAELHDTHVALDHAETGAGTFNAFRGKRTGRRIDWILFNRRFRALQSDIDRRDFSGRYPSDHFPVTATLRLLPATDTGAM